MASLVADPRSGSYYAQFYDKERRPSRKRISLKTKKKRVAERALAKMEDAYALGHLDPWASSTRTTQEEKEDLSSLGPASAAYIASCAHLREKTVKTYKEIVLPFARFTGEDVPVSKLRGSHVTTWLDSTRAGAVTRQKYVNHLGYLFRFLVRGGWMDSDVSKEVALRKPPEQAPKAMTPTEVETLVRTIETYNHAQKRADFSWLAKLVRFNVHVGLRRGELIHLRWKHIDIDRRTLRVANTDEFTTKSSKERTIPLSDSATSVLQDLRRSPKRSYVFELDSEKLNPNTLTHYFRRFRRDARLPEGINLHSTRHTFGTWLAERGVPGVVIKELMGHSSLKTTERYMKVRPATTRHWVDHVFSDGSPSIPTLQED